MIERRRNESMLHVGFSYGARKKLLTEFATRERTKAISASTKTRERPSTGAPPNLRVIP